jgi:hypothetical protein
MMKKGALIAASLLAGVLLLVLVSVERRVSGQTVPDAASEAEQDPHAQHGMLETMAGAGHQHDSHAAHMKFTQPRPASAADRQRASSVVESLRRALEQYEDAEAARQDGYQPFLENLPLPEYHFTNYTYAVMAAFSFNPERPTSLLYRKTRNGYELTGAMYTAPKHFSEDQLDKRIPLSVASWHAHVNLCMPRRGQQADWRRFGFIGSIATAEECDAAGGRFFPQLFGWMVHVYPYEADATLVWKHGGSAQH